MLRRFFRLVIIGAINHQMTLIVVESLLFSGFRDWVARRSRWAGELVRCHLCFGMWVGFLLALLFRPHVIETSPLTGLPRRYNRWFLTFAGFVADSFAIALVGRAFNEVLGIARREVSVLEEEKELLEEERQQLEAEEVANT